MATPYKIHLDAYDGPLDLLLDLIRKQEMDIHNIPIATITGQYLEYLHKLEQLDMDISADFIYMAATLILIKSKMLLPADPMAGPEEQGDPRAELVYRLVEHEKFKNAAQLLYQNSRLKRTSGPGRICRSTRAKRSKANWWFRWWTWCASSSMFWIAARKSRASNCGTILHRRADDGSPARALPAAEQGIELSDFFESCPSRSAMICALLAVLELVRLQASCYAEGDFQPHPGPQT